MSRKDDLKFYWYPLTFVTKSEEEFIKPYYLKYYQTRQTGNGHIEVRMYEESYGRPHMPILTIRDPKDVFTDIRLVAREKGLFYIEKEEFDVYNDTSNWRQFVPIATIILNSDGTVTVENREGKAVRYSSLEAANKKLKERCRFEIKQWMIDKYWKQEG